MADYDNVYEVSHTFYDYDDRTNVTITAHFESSLTYYNPIVTVNGQVMASCSASTGRYYCRMWFPPTWIPGEYWLDFYMAPDHTQTPKGIGYFRVNEATGMVNGQVKIEIYDFYNMTGLRATFYANCSDIFTHLDPSPPTIDRLTVTTNYLGAIDSVSLKARHPDLIKVSFSIKTNEGNTKSCLFEARNGVAEGTDDRWVDSFYWDSGHSYEYDLWGYTALTYYKLDEGTVTFDSKVTGIVLSNLSQMNTGQTQQARYTLLKPDGATGPFKYPGVTYSSSNTSVATINALGMITSVAYGTTTITVVSDDPWVEERFSDSKTLIVTPTPGAFPTLETDYTRITKGDIEDFLSAEEILKAMLNPSSWVTITFDGYSHSVFTIYELIGDIIENLQNLTGKYLADHPSSTTAQQLHSQAMGCTIDRENSLYPTGVTAWRVTFRTIARTLTELADLVL